MLDDNDPIFGAYIVAKKSSGDLTPGDALWAGLSPCGYTRHERGNGLPPNNPNWLAKGMTPKIQRAKAFIEAWNNDVSFRSSGELIHEDPKRQAEGTS